MCGSFVDPSLGEFSAGADWARKQGVRLERVNLATQPMDFVDHPLVKAILGGPPGETSLPVSLVDGQNALIETVRTRYAVGRNEAGGAGRSGLSGNTFLSRCLYRLVKRRGKEKTAPFFSVR